MTSKIDMTLLEQFKKEQVIPVIREKDFESGLEKSELAIKSGMGIIEITFTTPDADKIIKTLIKKHKVLVGAGTVLNQEDATKAINAGSKFIVSPAYTAEVAKICKEKKILYVPGAVTPTEIINAIDGGWKFVKIFPASVMGVSYIKTIKSVFPEVEIMATGGINTSNYKEWISTPLIAVGIGSDLFRGNNEEISQRIKQIKNG